MEMREPNLRVVDHETYPGNKTSKMLTRKELERTYPNQDQRKLSFIFEHERELLVPEKQAKLLRRKYGKVIEIVGQEHIQLKDAEKAQFDVDNLKRPALINLGARLNIKDCMKMKNEALVDAIKREIIAGKQPLTQSEYEERKSGK